MTDETVEPVQTARPVKKLKIVKKPKPAEREQSTIAFPYYDLETAIGVARVILNAGALSVTREQLAGLLGSSTNSGTFLTKMSATRMFGLITTGSGMIELTELGSSILDSDDRRAKKARADAFLNVPLFKRVYDEFRSRQLPPRPLPLEHALVKLGVSNSQKTTARLAFDRSAAQAGYFPNGNDRLIEPIIGGGLQRITSRAAVLTDRGADEEAEAVAPTKSRAPDKSELPHFMQMLIEKLPEPGTNWAIEGRAKWLQAAATSFDLMYMGDGEITILQVKTPHGDAKEES